MRILILVVTLTVLVLSLASGNNGSASPAYPLASLNSLVAAAPIAPRLKRLRGGAARAAATFSSAYTDLTKCGSGLTKKEEKEAEEQGSDIPTRCKGYGGYDIYVSYSACTSEISVEKGEASIHLATQAVNFKQKTAEWRLANGKPFAVIMRVYQYGGDDQCAVGGKITGESLIVKGLKGFEHIDGEVKVKERQSPTSKPERSPTKATGNV